MKFVPEYYTVQTVMYCPDEESARIFCDYLGKLGMKWQDGTSYVAADGYFYDPSFPYYEFILGLRASASWVNQHHVEVLQFDDFDWELNTENSNAEIDNYLKEYKRRIR